MVITDEEKLRIILAEYEANGREALEHLKFQFEIIRMSLVAIPLIVGFVFAYEEPRALFLIPFVTILLAYRFLWDMRVLVGFSRYHREVLAPQVKELARVANGQKDLEKKLLGWEEFYRSKIRKEENWLQSMMLLLGAPTALVLSYMLLYGIGQNILFEQWFNTGSPYLVLMIAYSVLCVYVILSGRKLRQQTEQATTKT